MKAGFTWECECGHTEYSEMVPEECMQCGRLDSFVQMPAEIIAEREREAMAEQLEEELKQAKLKSQKTTKRSKKK